MAETSSQAPPDKFKRIYFLFLLHGIAILLPWNMFINAIAYFVVYKLGKESLGYEFPYVGNFMQILTFSSQVPNVIFNWCNIFAPLKGGLALRIMSCIVVNIVVFIITIVLAMLDSSSWPYIFFYLTMISVVIMNTATGIYQNTIFGITAKLPPKYTQAIILGNNICGSFATVVCIIAAYTTTNQKMAAIWYFITAIFMLLIAFDTYYGLPLSKFYRYYDILDRRQQREKKNLETSPTKPPYWDVVKKAWPQMLNVFLVFFVCLAVFPSVSADIKVSSENFFIQDEFLYMQILCFLTFNVFAVVGSLLPSCIIWPPPKFLWLPVVLRLVYIPLFLICNYQPQQYVRSMPVLINNDYVYWIIGVTQAVTSGYFSTLAMMYAPSTVEPQYAYLAGMFAGAALMSGIFVGILSSFLWPWLVSSI